MMFFAIVFGAMAVVLALFDVCKELRSIVNALNELQEILKKKG